MNNINKLFFKGVRKNDEILFDITKIWANFKPCFFSMLYVYVLFVVVVVVLFSNVDRYIEDMMLAW